VPHLINESLTSDSVLRFMLKVEVFDSIRGPKFGWPNGQTPMEAPGFRHDAEQLEFNRVTRKYWRNYTYDFNAYLESII
jgi:hypothetical protein